MRQLSFISVCKIILILCSFEITEIEISIMLESSLTHTWRSYFSNDVNNYTDNDTAHVNFEERSIIQR